MVETNIVKMKYLEMLRIVKQLFAVAELEKQKRKNRVDLLTVNH